MPDPKPATININGKDIQLSELPKSKGGQRRYRAMAHVSGLGTVYVTAYTGVPKAERAISPELTQVLEVLKGLGARLGALEARISIDPRPRVPIPPPHPSA